MEKIDNQPTGAGSASSQETGKPPTTKTRNLIPEQALEILQEAARYCHQSGIVVQIAPFYGHSQQSVVIVLTNVKLVDGNLTHIEGD